MQSAGSSSYEVSHKWLSSRSENNRTNAETTLLASKTIAVATLCDKQNYKLTSIRETATYQVQSRNGTLFKNINYVNYTSIFCSQGINMGFMGFLIFAVLHCMNQLLPEPLVLNTQVRVGA